MTPGANEPPAGHDPRPAPAEPDGAIVAAGERLPQPSPPGGGRRPGATVFSLDARPAPGLYLVGWLASLGGLALVLVGILSAQPSVARALGIAGFFGIALGLSAAAGYQVLARRVREPAAYRGPAPLIVLGVAVAVAALPALVIGPLGLIDPVQPTGLVVSLAIVAAADVLAVWLLVVRTGALRWRDMGWPTWRGPHLTEVARDVAIAAAFTVPVTIGSRLVAALLVLLLDVEPPLQVPLPSSDLDIALLFLGAVIIAPIAEETVFRGLALTAWWRDLGARRAIVRSSLLFAIVHIANIDATSFGEGAKQALFEFVAILPIGVFLGWLFTQRGMAAAISGHATFNGIQLVLFVLLVRSGLLPVP